MLKLMKYMRAYILECVLGPLFKLFEATFELIIPLVVKSIIDRGITSNDKPYITKMALIMLLLSFIGFICAVSAQYFAAKAATGFAATLKTKLFKKIQSLSFTEIDSLGSATMITRLTSDVNQIQNGVNLLLRLFLRSPFIVFGAMVMAWMIDGDTALVFAGTIVLLLIVVFAIMLISIPLYTKVQKSLDSILGITRENLYGVRVIRAFRKEKSEIARFITANDALTAIQKFVGRISALMNPVTYIIINLAVIVLLKVGAIKVNSGNLTQGDVVALYNYMSQILIELIKLANLIITVTKSFACGDRVADVLAMQSSQSYPERTITSASIMPGSNDSESDAVTFNHVSLTYKNAGDASLSDISFSVKKGQTVGIIGGTGSGKTSLVNLIPRFYDATNGDILLDGIPVQNYAKDDLRQKIGIVPQKAALFRGTIAENIRWGKQDASNDELLEAMRIAQAADVIAAKASGIDEPVSQNGGNFSGGQKQRLTIARALVKQPEILILDDSASALDYATDAALRKSLHDLPGKPTVFIVSQRASTIMGADIIIVLDDGNAVGIGTHEQLLSSCPVYKEIYDSQFDQKGGAAK